MFTSPIFLSLLALLGASLLACTYTRQIPLTEIGLPTALLTMDLIGKTDGTLCNLLRPSTSRNFRTLCQEHQFKIWALSLWELDMRCILEGAGLAGRFAPIGVHLAMLLIMVGGTLSASGSFKGTVMVPQGLNFVIGDVMRPIGFLSTAAESFNTEVHVNKFYMNYYDSGLDLKTDPGVPVVYAGFGALMLTTCISFLSHSQIWALQDGTAVIVGGKTNRAKGEFPEEMNRLLDRVPELVNSSLSRQSDSTVS